MYGGGTSGGTTTQSFGSGGGGGTQTAGGAGGSNNAGTFGQGGQGLSASSGYGGAGGGGWYGGGGSYPDYSADDDRGGGGGSGYVYTSSTASNYPSGCLLNSSYYLTSASTTAGNIAFTSPTGTNETGHTGNGYIRITAIKAGSGNTLIKTTSNTWKEQKQMFVNTGISTTIPSGLVELEYIESTGTQYIDTGFKPNQDTRISITVDFPPSGTAWRWLYGGRTASNSNSFGFLRADGNAYRFDYANSTNKLTTKPVGKFILDSNKNKCYINGELAFTATYTTFASPVNMYIFNNNNNGSLSGGSSAKLYSCKIYNNGTLIRDFVPVKRISDNVYGLWDKVNEVLYENAGTGAFTGGPAVNLTGWHKIKGVWAKTTADTWSQAL